MSLDLSVLILAHQVAMLRLANLSSSAQRIGVPTTFLMQASP